MYFHKYKKEKTDINIGLLLYETALSLRMDYEPGYQTNETPEPGWFTR